MFSRTLILALAAAAAAAPHPSRGVTINMIKTDFKPLKDFRSALANAYFRYGGVLPETVSMSVEDTGSVVASPATNDREYLAPVQIGGQTVNLDFDTGSSDLWVVSNLTPANQSAGRTMYDISKSTTWKQLDGYTWKIGYADKSGCAGIVGTDTLNVGGMTLTSAAIEAATTISDSFVQNTEIDGLLGLAFSKLNTVKPVKQKTPYFAALPTLNQPYFAAYLKHQAPGSYDFGYLDPKKYSGDIHWTNVSTDLGYWTFNSSGVMVGNTTYNNAYPSVADTGTSLMLMNQTIVKEYYAQVPSAAYDDSQGGWFYDCWNKGSMPDFYVETGNGWYARIPAALMTYTSIDFGFKCFGSLQENTGMPYNLQILGDPFFKALYVAHDGVDRRIGFATQA